MGRITINNNQVYMSPTATIKLTPDDISRWFAGASTIEIQRAINQIGIALENNPDILKGITGETCLASRQTWSKILNAMQPVQVTSIDEDVRQAQEYFDEFGM